MSLHWVTQAVLQKLSIAGWLRAHGKFVRPELTKQQRQDLKECFELIDTDGSGIHLGAIIHVPCALQYWVGTSDSIPSFYFLSKNAMKMLTREWCGVSQVRLTHVNWWRRSMCWECMWKSQRWKLCWARWMPMALARWEILSTISKGQSWLHSIPLVPHCSNTTVCIYTSFAIDWCYLVFYVWVTLGTWGHCNCSWQVEYPEFVQIMTTKLDKQQEENAYAGPKPGMLYNQWYLHGIHITSLSISMTLLSHIGLTPGNLRI